MGEGAAEKRGPGPGGWRVEFPGWLERWLERFDDWGLRLVQGPEATAAGGGDAVAGGGGGFWYGVAMALTTATAIETGLGVPALCFALGWDRAGARALGLMGVTALLSQLPKRFVWRARPWMMGRARPRRRDSTSSFPSRGVLCAVVFAEMGLQGWSAETGVALPIWARVATAAAAAAATAWARLFVGAHYPSDAVAGAMLGGAVVALAPLAERLGCGRDGAGSLPLWALGRATVAGYGATLLSMQGFWAKCAYVYALLFAPAAFRYAFLCPGASPLPPAPRPPGAPALLRALATFGGWTLAGMAARRGKSAPARLAAFSGLYFGALASLLYWRLGPGTVAAAAAGVGAT